ncbi:hypothetical protein TEK04_08400 [Klenkia sp. LSe6-5]|uniref:Transposase n=1 Tax=Klenkia sesuvii TaxID=3103137 RepID=A0ABU8DUL1_9ACTN
MPDFDDVADELYAVLPAEFVGARTDAVAEAKRTDKALARRIGELGKPTLAAWTVNLLVREAGDQVTELVDLGDLLRRAQDDLDPDQLRALDKQRRQVVRALAREAGKFARRAGHPVSDQVLVQVEETLKAAVADPAAAEVVLAGRLTGALTYNGIGAPSETTTTTGRPPRRPTAPSEPPPPPVDLGAARAAKADRAARREAEEKLRAARATLRAARTAVDDAVGELDQATAAAREAAQAAAAAGTARDDARARVSELEEALAQARERAGQADDEAATAERGAEQADADRAAAEEDLQRAEADRDRAQQVVDELT